MMIIESVKQTKKRRMMFVHIAVMLLSLMPSVAVGKRDSYNVIDENTSNVPKHIFVTDGTLVKIRWFFNERVNTSIGYFVQVKRFPSLNTSRHIVSFFEEYMDGDYIGSAFSMNTDYDGADDDEDGYIDSYNNYVKDLRITPYFNRPSNMSTNWLFLDIFNVTASDVGIYRFSDDSNRDYGEFYLHVIVSTYPTCYNMKGLLVDLNDGRNNFTNHGLCLVRIKMSTNSSDPYRLRVSHTVTYSIFDVAIDGYRSLYDKPSYTGGNGFNLTYGYYDFGYSVYTTTTLLGYNNSANVGNVRVKGNYHATFSIGLENSTNVHVYDTDRYDFNIPLTLRQVDNNGSSMRGKIVVVLFIATIVLCR